MKLFSLFTLVFLLSSPTLAQNKRIEDLEQRLKALTEEVLNLKTEKETPELSKSFSGLGVGASKVYQQEGLSVGGYAELLYTSPRGDGGATSDAYRLVPYLGYKFNDLIVFNSEIELEHGGVNGQDRGGVVSIEFAFLDFLFDPAYSLRAGHILVPVGRVNLKHEPIFFYSTLRPEIEKNIIPSTWHENGLMLFGEKNSLSYQVGVVNSGDLSTNRANSSSWIRSARTKGSRSKSEDLSVFARLDYEFGAGNTVGASYYTGNTTHDEPGRGDGTVEVMEAHLDYRLKDLIVNALYVRGTLSDTDVIKEEIENDPGPNTFKELGSEVSGYYLTVAYDLKNVLNMNTSLIPFVRYSEYNLHDEVTTGTPDLTLDKKLTTFGVSYFPHSQVVIKADYQKRENALDNEADKFNLALGLVF